MEDEEYQGKEKKPGFDIVYDMQPPIIKTITLTYVHPFICLICEVQNSKTIKSIRITSSNSCELTFEQRHLSPAVLSSNGHNLFCRLCKRHYQECEDLGLIKLKSE